MKLFNKPEVYEIINYLTTNKNYDDFTAQGFAEQFWNYYESNGWRVGRNPMKNWKAAIRTWEINRKNGTYAKQPNSGKVTNQQIDEEFTKFYSGGKRR